VQMASMLPRLSLAKHCLAKQCCQACSSYSSANLSLSWAICCRIPSLDRRPVGMYGLGSLV
jgi:hypothetical protein